jgi:hypothetical protein
VKTIRIEKDGVNIEYPGKTFKEVLALAEECSHIYLDRYDQVREGYTFMGSVYIGCVDYRLTQDDYLRAYDELL